MSYLSLNIFLVSFCFVRLMLARERKIAEQLAEQALQKPPGEAAGAAQDQQQTLLMETGAEEPATRFDEFVRLFCPKSFMVRIG